MQTIQAKTVQVVCCPNCGSPAERYHTHSQGLSRQRSQQQCIRTQCQRCDYLMVTCAQTGGVIEAYAPGIPFMTQPIMTQPTMPQPIAKTIETLAVDRKPHPLLNL